jgi:hypothetical protein
VGKTAAFVGLRRLRSIRTLRLGCCGLFTGSGGPSGPRLPGGCGESLKSVGGKSRKGKGEGVQGDSLICGNFRPLGPIISGINLLRLGCRPPFPLLVPAPALTIRLPLRFIKLYEIQRRLIGKHDA